MATLQKSEAVYKWTVRGLYLVAIGINVYWALEAYADSPEAAAVRSKGRVVLERVARPWHERKNFRRMATEVQLEAWRVVEDVNNG